MRSLLIALGIALALPGVASAQSLGGLVSTAAFTVSATPQYPVPYGTVTLSFLSNSLNLAGATLTVTVGKKNIYKGAVQPVSVPLGAAGGVVNVSATVSSGGASYTQTLSIDPQDVALEIEPIASAPALYPGKPSVPLEGSVRVVAIANLKNAVGGAFDPNILSYTWTVDGARIADSSGIGRAALMVASPLQYRARTVSVVVASPADGSLVGGAEVSFAPQEPSIRIYANDPLLGIRFDHALGGGYTIADTESTLYAAPFSLPISQGAPFLQWFLNGQAAQTGDSITLRPTGNGQGNASLSVTASAGDSARATTGLSLSFGAKSGTNFFGL